MTTAMVAATIGFVFMAALVLSAGTLLALEIADWMKE